MFTGKPGHLRTFSYRGLHRYFLTFCTNDRTPVFVEDSVVNLVLSQIRRAADDETFAIVAYCLMPNHMHLLAEGRALESDALRFIARAKQFSGYSYAGAHGRPLWQRYSYEHVLRDDETTKAVARYVLENPVRAGLVQRVEDYPYVGSFTWRLAELLDWIADRGSG